MSRALVSAIGQFSTPLPLFNTFKKLLKAFRYSTDHARYGFQTLKKYKCQVLKYKRQVKCS